MAPPLLHFRLHPQCFLLPRFRRSVLRLSLKTLCSSSFSDYSPAWTPPPVHGPSLRRGRAPPADHPDPFARSFDLAALRVPAAACAPLERRLRGHLLNWPRVRNVARLPNDQEGLLALGLSLPSPPRLSAEESGTPAPVARREKLAREFNARGFVRFPNLARLSRPSPAARKQRERKAGGGRDKDKVYVVEVVGEGREGDEDDDDLKGLVGEEGLGRRTGPSRLLLLDQKYAGRGVDELPEAIKVTLPLQIQDQTKIHSFQVLEALLPEGVIIPTGFETVGHIAHLNLRDEHLPYEKLIAQVVLDKNKPKIQTIVNKTDSIENDYRTLQLEVLAGNDLLHTMVIESGLRFQVELGIVYWNSRLATERQRLVNNIFKSSDVVCKSKRCSSS